MKVYVMSPKHPLRRIKAAEVDIRTCAKSAWAVLPDGHRHLLGTSAFFSESAATRAQIGCVSRVLRDRWLQQRRPQVYAYARQMFTALSHSDQQLSDKRDTLRAN